MHSFCKLRHKLQCIELVFETRLSSKRPWQRVSLKYKRFCSSLSLIRLRQQMKRDFCLCLTSDMREIVFCSIHIVFSSSSPISLSPLFSFPKAQTQIHQYYLYMFLFLTWYIIIFLIIELIISSTNPSVQPMIQYLYL